MRTTPLAALLFLGWAPAALAQQPPPSPAPSPTTIEPAPRPAVSDPMLAPPPAPRRVITSWDDAFKLVRTRSTELRISYDQVKKAEAQSRIALAGALPSLTAQGIASHVIWSSPSDSSGSGGGTGPATGDSTGATSGGNNTLSARITLSQPLIDVRAWHAIGTAHVSEEAARLSYDDLERTIAANVASTIVSTVTAERVAELNRVGLRNALERLQFTVAKESTGTGTGLDIVRAKQDVAAARGAIVSGDESLRQAREALGLALGVTEPVGVSPTTDLAGLERGALKACKPLADLEKRADIAAARKRLEVAQRNITDVDHQFLPTLTAQSTLSTSLSDATRKNVTTGDNVGVGPRSSWDIQAVLSIPIWDGGARYGQRRSAVAEEDAAAQELEALRRTASIGLAQSRRAVEVAESSRAIAAESRELAADVDRLALSAYRTGKGTSLDIVTAAAALRQAEINLALQEFTLVRARIDQLLALATCSR